MYRGATILHAMLLSPTARQLLADRYARNGESPEAIFRRVASAVDTPGAAAFRQAMERLVFLPNSPTLMNAGTVLGQLSACFVLPVEDSLECIFSALSSMAMIHKSGGGTGFSFSRIRPKGDMVQGTAGVASGPVSFIRVFDAATEAVRQGGRRRGANMGVLASSHPDIIEFANSKRSGSLRNFNLSVGFDAAFFECLEQGTPYELVNPRDGSVWGEIEPDALWNRISEAAWATGDPGMLFLDEINGRSTLPGLGRIEATNPCGEQPLLPYESCNLGSINLTTMIRDEELDDDLLIDAVRLGIDFLDAVIDVNRFPLQKIRERTLLTRKIGLGVMGFAEMLVLLGIPYASEEAVATAHRLMALIQREARTRSRELGEEKGSFPAIDASCFSGPMRNATVTTIAPTGALHLIADTSEGIEPFFSLAYRRRIAGRTVEMVNEHVIRAFERFSSRSGLIDELRRTGSIQEMPLPDDVKDLFRTAHEIPPEQHVRMQAAFQLHVDNAVSKTVNLPESATVEEVSRIFAFARSCGCKGITIYRNGSRPDQVLTGGCAVCRTT